MANKAKEPISLETLEALGHAIVKKLNAAMAFGPGVVQELVATRIPCSTEFAEASPFVGFLSDDGTVAIGCLGVLNGLLFGDTSWRISSHHAEADDKLLNFTFDKYKVDNAETSIDGEHGSELRGGI